MKTQRHKILGREFWLLSLPLLLLGGVALLRESINSNPLRIQVDSIEQVEPSISTNRTHADTVVRFKLSVVGNAPLLTNRNTWTWDNDIRLVAVKEGKILDVARWIPNPKPDLMIGFSSSNISTTEHEWSIRSRDIPREWDDLELQGTIAFGPPGNTIKSKIAYIEKTGKGVVLPIKIPVKRLDK